MRSPAAARWRMASIMARTLPGGAAGTRLRAGSPGPLGGVPWARAGVREGGPMSYTQEYDALLAEQPEDWAFFECYLTVDDPRKLADARVALSRANARPVRGEGDH